MPESPDTPEVLTFDPDDLTVGDIEDFEETSGLTLSDVIGPGRQINMPAKALKALVWIIKRKSDESFTLDDARNVKVTQFNVNVKKDPTDAAPASSG